MHPTAHPPLIVSLALLLVVTACATVEKDPTKDWSPQRLYTEGKSALANGEYATAIEYFEKLEARYPYGAYAEQAQLEVAYAYYKDEEMSSAVAAANRFIRIHPTHPHVDYAYYLRGLAHFNEERGFVDRLLGAGDLSDRDPRALRDAYDSFRELVERFPKSRYAKDSRERMAYLINALAKSEIHVARYYYSRGAYVAAVNRTRQVIEGYPRTPSVEDALGIQAKAYKQMGLEELMNDTLRVLKMNFPGSRYIEEVRALSATKDAG